MLWLSRCLVQVGCRCGGSFGAVITPRVVALTIRLVRIQPSSKSVRPSSSRLWEAPDNSRDQDPNSSRRVAIAGTALRLAILLRQLNARGEFQH